MYILHISLSKRYEKPTRKQVENPKQLHQLMVSLNLEKIFFGCFTLRDLIWFDWLE